VGRRVSLCPIWDITADGRFTCACYLGDFSDAVSRLGQFGHSFAPRLPMIPPVCPFRNDITERALDLAMIESFGFG
jgi:hypothetical protein